MEQVIKFDELGRMTGLVHKKVGINLTQIDGAECDVDRASDIIWYKKTSQWRVKVLKGTGAGMYITQASFKAATGEIITANGLIENYYDGTDNHVLLFDDYDEAVQCEIKYFNGWAKQPEGTK